jgi:hypothetical protein
MVGIIMALEIASSRYFYDILNLINIKRAAHRGLYAG